MRSRKMHVLGLILFVVATASAQEKPTNPVELTGTVKSETGAPLAGVDILTYAPYAGTINLGSLRRHDRLDVFRCLSGEVVSARIRFTRLS